MAGHVGAVIFGGVTRPEDWAIAAAGSHQSMTMPGEEKVIVQN